MRRRGIWRAGVAAVLVLAAAGARGAQAPGCHAMDGMGQGGGPAETPAPRRMEGIGNSQMEISTSSAEARMWFEQGLNLLHDFWDYESLRAFQQSVRLDPGCAMCWWGVYEAEEFRGGHETEGTAALLRAVTNKRNASKDERLYLRAAMEEERARSGKVKEKARKGEPDRLPHVDSRSTKALRSLVRRRPEDIQARIFLAESVEDGFGKDGEPRAGMREAMQILGELLREHPEDSAVNHYWIHAVEPGAHPEMALESARRLSGLAPASGHMVHMPGHIFFRTGDYEAARTAFLASMRTDEGYMAAEAVSPDNDWNYVHNLMYLIANCLEEGRVREATEMSAKLNRARGSGVEALYRGSTRDGLTRLDPELPVELRTGNWAGATRELEASRPAAELVTLGWLRTTMLDYTRGMGALERGDTTGAERQRDAMDEAMKKQPEPAARDGMAAMVHGGAKDAMLAPLRSWLDVAAHELRASVLMAEGKKEEADAAFATATAMEGSLGYHEPPMYIRPVEETRGDALLRAKRFGDAKGAYEAALRARPNSGYALSGVARADAAMKDDDGATVAYGRVLAVWSHADAQLPPVVEAKIWMERHTALARMQ